MKVAVVTKCAEETGEEKDHVRNSRNAIIAILLDSKSHQGPEEPLTDEVCSEGKASQSSGFARRGPSTGIGFATEFIRLRRLYSTL